MSNQPTDFRTEYERAAYTMFAESGNPYLWQLGAKERYKFNNEIERER